MVYPWQQTQWQQLQRQCMQSRPPQALLITGLPGMGKFHFARQLAAWTLCTNPSTTACNYCSSCRLFAANTHPDYLALSPLEGKTQIGVDQVRELTCKLQQTPALANGQFALINPAEAMNLAASNAFLKTLEEPAANTTLVLVSHQPSQLLATVRSRCQAIHFTIPPRALSEAWLQQQVSEQSNTKLLLALTQGAPISAYQLVDSGLLEQREQGFTSLLTATSALQLAADFAKQPVSQVITFLQSVLLDLMRLTYHSADSFLTHYDKKSLLQKYLAKLTVEKLFMLQEELIQAKKIVNSSQTLNTQLFLESVFIVWFDSVCL